MSNKTKSKNVIEKDVDESLGDQSPDGFKWKWFTCTAANPWEEAQSEGLATGMQALVEHPDALRELTSGAWFCPHCLTLFEKEYPLPEDQSEDAAVSKTSEGVLCF